MGKGNHVAQETLSFVEFYDPRTRRVSGWTFCKMASHGHHERNVKVR